MKGGEREEKRPEAKERGKARRLYILQSVLLAIDIGRSTTQMNREN